MAKQGISFQHVNGRVYCIAGERALFALEVNAAYMAIQQIANSIRQTRGQDELAFTEIVNLVNEGKPKNGT